MPPQRRCRAGIARSYQIPQPFANLTVFENLLVGAVHGRGKTGARGRAGLRRDPRAARAARRANTLAGSLTLLERKRLELARALATAPRLLLLDEIAGGLTEGECPELVDTIRDIRATGVTIVWIEHVVHALLAVVDRLVVLNFGRKIAEGEPKDGDAARPRCARSIWASRPDAMPLLETRNLTAFYGDFQALFGIDTTLDAGETVAIIGANGAGKSTFLQAIAGLLPARPDSVLLDGAPIGARAGRRDRASSASRWCRRGGGCFPRSRSRRTC